MIIVLTIHRNMSLSKIDLSNAICWPYILLLPLLHALYRPYMFVSLALYCVLPTSLTSSKMKYYGSVVSDRARNVPRLDILDVYIYVVVSS